MTEILSSYNYNDNVSSEDDDILIKIKKEVKEPKKLASKVKPKVKLVPKVKEPIEPIVQKEPIEKVIEPVVQVIEPVESIVKVVEQKEQVKIVKAVVQKEQVVEQVVESVVVEQVVEPVVVVQKEQVVEPIVEGKDKDLRKELEKILESSLTNDEKANLIIPMITLIPLMTCNGITSNGNACKVSIGLRQIENKNYCQAHYKKVGENQEMKTKVKGTKVQCGHFKGMKQCGNSGLYDGYCRFHKS